MNCAPFILGLWVKIFVPTPKNPLTPFLALLGTTWADKKKTH